MAARPLVAMHVLNLEPYCYSHSAVLEWLNAGFGYYEFGRLPLDFNPSSIVLLIVRLSTKIDKSIIDQYPSLQYIVSSTTGSDHVDLDYVKSKNILFFSLREHASFLSSIPSTAEHTWALICASSRNLVHASQSVSLGSWDRDTHKGWQLKGKSIGIIGLGRIGSKVAQYATAFDMRVSYYDPYVYSCEYRRHSDLADLLSQSDIVSIHVHLNQDTRFLLDSKALSSVKENSVLVNTSRSEVWDEAAVAELVETSRVRAVATDVLAGELTDIRHSPLWLASQKYSSVLITPHIAGATHEAMAATEEYLAHYVSTLLKSV